MSALTRLLQKLGNEKKEGDTPKTKSSATPAPKPQSSSGHPIDETRSPTSGSNNAATHGRLSSPSSSSVTRTGSGGAKGNDDLPSRTRDSGGSDVPEDKSHSEGSPSNSTGRRLASPSGRDSAHHRDPEITDNSVGVPGSIGVRSRRSDPGRGTSPFGGPPAETSGSGKVNPHPFDSNGEASEPREHSGSSPPDSSALSGERGKNSARHATGLPITSKNTVSIGPDADSGPEESTAPSAEQSNHITYDQFSNNMTKYSSDGAYGTCGNSGDPEVAATAYLRRGIDSYCCVTSPPSTTASTPVQASSHGKDDSADDFSFHQLYKRREMSAPSTPRRTPPTSRSPNDSPRNGSGENDSDFPDVPEGLLATEGTALTASFSLAPTCVTTPDAPDSGYNAANSIKAEEEKKAAVLTAIDLTCYNGQMHAVLGDAGGRVELLEADDSRAGVCAGYNPLVGPASRASPQLRALSTNTSRTDSIDPSQKPVKKSVGPFSRRSAHQAFIEEFDCLKSVTVDQQLRCVKFLPANRSPDIVSYLAANERTIKLFRIRSDQNTLTQAAQTQPSSRLTTPRARIQKRILMPVKAFTNVHQFMIQSLSLSTDAETFLSADDFQIYWWHLEASDTTRATLLADVKPVDSEDISTLLTAAAFHQSHGSLFLVANSNGVCDIGDLRHPMSRTKRDYQISFKIRPELHNPVQHPEHNDVLSAICAASFLGSDYVVTRDYFTLKLWDMRRQTDPVSVCPVMDFLSPCFDSLYDTDFIFDRFPLAVDDESLSVVTGLYNGTVALWRPGRTPPPTMVPGSLQDPKYEEVEFLSARSAATEAQFDSRPDDYTTLPPLANGRTYADTMARQAIIKSPDEDDEQADQIAEARKYQERQEQKATEESDSLGAEASMSAEESEPPAIPLYPRLRTLAHNNHVTNISISPGGQRIGFTTNENFFSFSSNSL